MTERFRSRGYAESDISAAYERARSTQRSHLLVKTKRASKQRLCFSTDFSHIGGEIKHVSKKHGHILQSDPALKDICTELPRITFKHPHSFRDRLVHTTMSPPPKPMWLPAPPLETNRHRTTTSSSSSSWFNSPAITSASPVTGSPLTVSVCVCMLLIITGLVLVTVTLVRRRRSHNPSSKRSQVTPGNNEEICRITVIGKEKYLTLVVITKRLKTPRENYPQAPLIPLLQLRHW
ncbi:unnamed protein product [Leuciscus chuanchicus]